MGWSAKYLMRKFSSIFSCDDLIIIRNPSNYYQPIDKLTSCAKLNFVNLLTPIKTACSPNVPMKRKMWWLKRSSSPHLCVRYLMLFCTVGFVLLPTSYVWANPAGEAVVGGAATFQRDGNKLTVNQATDRLAVNWQSPQSRHRW